jgi:hypothetical protein
MAEAGRQAVACGLIVYGDLERGLPLLCLLRRLHPAGRSARQFAFEGATLADVWAFGRPVRILMKRRMLRPFYAASSAGGHSQGQREDAGGASLAQEHGGNGHRPAGIDLIVDEQDRTGAGVGLDGGREVIRHGQGAPE